MSGAHGPATYRWWLRLQLGLVVAGGLCWIGGAVAEQDFFTGVGLGLLLAALALRLGRRSAPDAPSRLEPDEEPRSDAG